MCIIIDDSNLFLALLSDLVVRTHHIGTCVIHVSYSLISQSREHVGDEVYQGQDHQDTVGSVVILLMNLIGHMTSEILQRF